MQLQDDPWGDGDSVMALMDYVEDVPVAGDLLLVAVLGFCLIEHELAQALVKVEMFSILFDAPVLWILATSTKVAGWNIKWYEKGAPLGVTPL